MQLKPIFPDANPALITMPDGAANIGILVYAPNETARDAEISRLMEADVAIVMSCGFSFAATDLPKEWGLKMCPCGDPSHTLWDVREND